MIDKLRELSEIAPDICDPYGDAYDIGMYRFSFLSDGTLRASTGAAMEEGRPALAWLRDALEAEIEARGWGWESYGWQKGYTAMLILESDGVKRYRGTGDVSFDTPAEALLAALLAAGRWRGRNDAQRG